MTATDTSALLRRLERLETRRSPWEGLWRDCYAYAFPQREPGTGRSPGQARTAHLFDGTAPDAVDQLAASLLAQLAPPWSRWFGLAAGREIPDGEQALAARELDRVSDIVQGHFDRSNLAIELHQCFLDLVTGGTGILQFEEAPVGHASAFRFTAVPLEEMFLEEGADGRLDVAFRRLALPADLFRARFPKAVLDPQLKRSLEAGDAPDLPVIEAVVPQDRGYRYAALRAEDGGSGTPSAGGPPLAEGRFDTSPFIAFRWMKAPGEHWGRSPVMKALPDIRTANKVVELVLKAAASRGLARDAERPDPAGTPADAGGQR